MGKKGLIIDSGGIGFKKGVKGGDGEIGGRNVIGIDMHERDVMRKFARKDEIDVDSMLAKAVG